MSVIANNKNNSVSATFQFAASNPQEAKEWVDQINFVLKGKLFLNFFFHLFYMLLYEKCIPLFLSFMSLLILWFFSHPVWHSSIKSHYHIKGVDFPIQKSIKKNHWEVTNSHVSILVFHWLFLMFLWCRKVRSAWVLFIISDSYKKHPIHYCLHSQAQQSCTSSLDVWFQCVTCTNM